MATYSRTPYHRCDCFCYSVTIITALCQRTGLHTRHELLPATGLGKRTSKSFKIIPSQASDSISSSTSFVENTSVLMQFGIEICRIPTISSSIFWTRLGLAGIIIFLMLQGAFWKKIKILLTQFRENPLYLALIIGLAGSMIDLIAHGLIDNSIFVLDLAYIFMLLVGSIANLGNQDSNPQISNPTAE